MTARTWLYSRLSTWPGLVLLQGDRVFAKKSMTSSVEDHPFTVFKLGNATNAALAETVDVANQFCQIYVHDVSDEDGGDYQRIDSIITEMKRALINANSAPDGIISVQFLETSQDLNDETLGTIMKYVRIQLIVKEP